LIEDQQPFNNDQPNQIEDVLGINWGQCDLETLQVDLEIELEHGVRDPTKKVSYDDHSKYREDCLGANKR
jgi:hypothetical protein